MRSIQQILEGKPRAVHAVGPTDTVYAAIARMAEHHVGALVVIDQGRLVGIVSERDYARKVVLQGKSSQTTAVSDIMSSPVHTISPDDRANAAMRIMTDKRIRHLPVVSAGTMVGMLSIGDLLKVVIADQKAEIAELNRYISG